MQKRTFNAEDIERINLLCAREFHRIVHVFGGVAPQYVRSDGGFRCPCPIHSGDDPNFSWEPRRRLWTCFSGSCGMGSPLDFIAKVSGKKFYDALCDAADYLRYKDELTVEPIVARPPAEAPVYLQEEELLSCRGYHPYLERVPEGVRQFLECGYCDAPTHALYGRMTFPVYDPEGKLLGITGRRVADTPPDDAGHRALYHWDHKYLHYGASKKNGFRRGVTLFNYSRIKDLPLPLIIVEGPFDVARIIEFGYHAVVALQASIVTQDQWKLLAGKHIVYGLDADTYTKHENEQHSKFTRFHKEAAAHRCTVSLLRLPKDTDPGDCNRETFERALWNALAL